jgi:hypothetical protein
MDVLGVADAKDGKEATKEHILPSENRFSWADC